MAKPVEYYNQTFGFHTILLKFPLGRPILKRTPFVFHIPLSAKQESHLADNTPRVHTFLVLVPSPI